MLLRKSLEQYGYTTKRLGRAERSPSRIKSANTFTCACVAIRHPRRNHACAAAMATARQISPVNALDLLPSGLYRRLRLLTGSTFLERPAGRPFYKSCSESGSRARFEHCSNLTVGQELGPRRPYRRRMIAAEKPNLPLTMPRRSYYRGL